MWRGTQRAALIPIYLPTSNDTPSPPFYWNHGVRRRFSSGSLILKDLQLKSLRTNDLAAILLCLVVKDVPKMALVRDRGPSLEADTVLPWPIRFSFSTIASGDVCEGDHWLDVMLRDKPALYFPVKVAHPATI